MVGKVLGNRYEIIEKVGGGGMALVYKAKCKLLNRYVAVKILREEFINDKDLLDKFRKESQAAASLSHPNIVNIYDVGEEDEIYYIVMEYIDGKTLKEVIKEKGSLSTDEILDYSKQIALALKHAHSNNVIHRDIKPHNILVTEDGRAKVTDFGIALAATSSTITNTGSIIGSVHYFAPEQARGGYTDEKTDLYSLGIVMYEMATGKLPFEGDAPVTIALKHIQEIPEPPSNYNSSIPDGLESIIMKLIQKEQSARYSGATDLIEDLYKVKSNIDLGNIDNTLKIEDSPTQIIPSVTAIEMRELINSKDEIKSNNEATKKNKKRKPLLIPAIVAALVAALLFTFGFFYLSNIFNVEDVVVPNFEGWNIKDAEKEAEDIGLRLKVTLISNKDVPIDEIIKQETSEGMKVRKGTIINVSVSKGGKLVTVPDLMYETSTDANLILKKLGLEIGVVDDDFSELPEGTVIMQYPKSKTEVEKGSKVNYTLSKGMEVKTIAMPELVGKTLEEAKDIIAQKGLELGAIDEDYSDKFVKGYVMEQNIPSKQEVNIGSVINLKVSKGSDVPDQDEDLDEDDKNKDEETNPPGTSTQLISFSLEGYTGEVDIVIEEIIGNKTKKVYNKKHDIDKEGNTVRIPLTETGHHVYAIYINEDLLGRKPIDF